MPFLGNTPANTFVSIAKQTITGNGGTTYTLSYPVTNANEIDVFYNNVRQEPTAAYTASGTTITFTEAIQSTDSVYVIFNGQAIGTIDAPAGAYLPTTGGTVNGNVTLNKNWGSNSGALTLTGDKPTLLMNSNSTYGRWLIHHGSNENGSLEIYRDTDGAYNWAPRLKIDPSGRVTLPNQVSFSAGFSTSYTQLSGVRDVQFNYKNFDIGTNFNTSTYRFTAPVTGKYLMSAFVGTNGGASSNAYFGISFSINGSNQGLCWYNSASGYQKDAISQIVHMNANDYINVVMEVQNNTTLNTGNFSGHLIG